MDQATARLGLGVRRFGEARLGRDPFGVAEAFATVALALDAGITLIDCPSEPDAPGALLGDVLPPAAPMQIVLHAGSVAEGPEAMTARLRTAIGRLRRTRVDAVLLRAAAALRQPGGVALWDALLQMKDEGLVGAAGIAACVCDRPAELARRFRPDLMQLPLSLLDQRLLTDGTLDAVTAQGIELHLRTAFLHGVAFYEPVATDPSPPLAGPITRLRQMLAEAGADPMQAALAFALAQPRASRVVVEVGSAVELRALVAAAGADRTVLDWAALRQDAGCGSLGGICVAA